MQLARCECWGLVVGLSLEGLLVMLFKGKANVDGGCGDLESVQGRGFTLLKVGIALGHLAELVICHAIFF